MKHAKMIPVLLFLLSAGPASAGEKASGHWLLNPTPREQARELSTDRPDTTESAYTVDAGHFQVEIEALSFSRDKVGDASTNTINASINAKVGLTDFIDLQAVLEPVVNLRVRDTTGFSSTTGIGDMTFRLKVSIWGNDGGRTAFALMPFVMLPFHSKSLDANNGVGFGLIAPLAIDLGAGFGAGVMLQLEAVRNAANTGYVAEFMQTATVGHDIIGDLGGFAEVVNIVNSEKGARQTYLDVGLTYGLTNLIQLDAGTNIGLTSASEDLRFFLGFSLRN